jgi:hypothetical protein
MENSSLPSDVDQRLMCLSFACPTPPPGRGQGGDLIAFDHKINPGPGVGHLYTARVIAMSLPYAYLLAGDRVGILLVNSACIRLFKKSTPPLPVPSSWGGIGVVIRTK